MEGDKEKTVVINQKNLTVEKAQSIDPWNFFRMEDFSLPQIKEHVPELIDEKEEIDYELAFQVMFKILKSTYETAKSNHFALKSGKKSFR